MKTTAQKLIKRIETKYFGHIVDKLMTTLNTLPEEELKKVFDDALKLEKERSATGFFAMTLAGSAKCIYEDKFKKPIDPETKSLAE